MPSAHISMIDMLLGAGKVGKANTGDGRGCGVGKEAISRRQVCVCGDDHSRSSSVHVQTSVHCSPYWPHRHLRWPFWPSHFRLRRISSCMSLVTISTCKNMIVNLMSHFFSLLISLIFFITFLYIGMVGKTDTLHRFSPLVNHAVFLQFVVLFFARYKVKV